MNALARSLTGPFAFAGIGVSHQGNRSHHVASHDGLKAHEHSICRVASISKTVTGALIDPSSLSTDVSELLGFRLLHPDHTDVPITMGMLASHQAGLADAGGYLLEPGDRLADWVAAKGKAIWSDQRPGTHFDYSNLGYVILGTALEANGRFDHLASAYLRDAGISGGFNWSGVSAADRRGALATYRRDGDQFVPQIDADVRADGVIGAKGQPLDLSSYVAGQNAGIFSPQGGLRTSLAGMLRIAELLRDHPARPLWSPEMGTMDPCDGLFDQYGTGVQILRNPPFYPAPLIGHFGNAYGFQGGVWYDKAADMAFAYALNGRKVNDESDALSKAELEIFAAIAALRG